MYYPKIEAGSFREVDPTSVTGLTWMAREMLGGYMDQGLRMNMNATPFDQEDDDSEDESLPFVHTTQPVPINKTDLAWLSNLPDVVNDHNLLTPYDMPGYVALRVDPIENPQIDCALHLDERYRQWTFRPPNPSLGTAAAIFEGWSIEDAYQITGWHTRKLHRLYRLLNVVRMGLQHSFATDPNVAQDSYHATVPVDLTGDILEKLGIAED